MLAEEAADAWGAEAAGVVDACREAAGRWWEWWVGRARELVVREAAGSDGSGRFVVERFPAYVEAVLARAAAVVEAAAAEKLAPVSAHPADMVPRRDAIRNHLLIFAGSVVATLFLAEKIVR